MIKYLRDKFIYEEVIRKEVPGVQSFLWIGTADIKDMYVHGAGGMVPFLKIIDQLIRKKIAVRLIHAKEPGPNFRKDFDQLPHLWDALEKAICPRVHFKVIIMDGRLAYIGSANLTGAGMGAKSQDKRNIENGILTDDPVLVDNVMNHFDDVWIGKYCKTCGRRDFCKDRIDK